MQPESLELEQLKAIRAGIAASTAALERVGAELGRRLDAHTDALRSIDKRVEVVELATDWMRRQVSTRSTPGTSAAAEASREHLEDRLETVAGRVDSLTQRLDDLERGW